VGFGRKKGTKCRAFAGLLEYEKKETTTKGGRLITKKKGCIQKKEGKKRRGWKRKRWLGVMPSHHREGRISLPKGKKREEEKKTLSAWDKIL